MNKPLLTFFLVIAFVSAKAQKQDTAIYDGCKLASDTTKVKGNPSILDSCPQFENGLSDLNNYISTHIRYQTIGKHPYKDEKVIVEIIVEKTGNLSHVKIAHSNSDYLNKEALRVVSSLPKWKPGTLRRRKVRVRYWIVVAFKPSSKTG